MSTSFKKKSLTLGHTSLPSGTKLSLTNSQLLLSSGIPSLDAFLDGGLAVGTVLLIEEDSEGLYAQILQKCFLAEGATCNHRLIIAASEESLLSVVNELPQPVLLQSKPVGNENELLQVSDKHLKIAWRYENAPKQQPPASYSSFGHTYDLSTTLSKETVERLNVDLLFLKMDLGREARGSVNPTYHQLFKEIEGVILRFSSSIPDDRTRVPEISRISILSLGSALWNEQMASSKNCHFDESLTWFLLALRSLLRRSYAVAVVSIPVELFQDKQTLRRIEHCCDAVVALDSFPSSAKDQNPMFKEYDGLFHLRRFARLNSICGPDIDASDLVFKIRRKKISVEKMHLPPDLSEKVSRSQSGLTLATGIGCGTSGNRASLLDF